MMKKIIDLDKEYQCSTDNYSRLDIETENYIIKIKDKSLLNIIKKSCEKLTK